ncbi:ribonuclease VapC [Haloferula luteola]|uniref:Ribonuclease VapC n=1 Tax=Haloferula luteola TaxID=595692 RepID=A0A840V9V7_9BACT|nr:type II toxin-antitoxin system VapC family toxin [Haloferula luteola]MBB5353866.1 ribonuclease VapC [Haloferula luteola]
MIVDSSAILAIFLEEPEQDTFIDAILRADHPRLSAANYLEICLRVDGAFNEAGRQAFDELLATLELEIVPVTVSQAKTARIANRLFGRGSGHKARLNYGDCFAYALAKESDLPLLFKGNDFLHTDLKLWR